MMPERFCAARLHVIDDAMPAAFATAAGRWVYEHRAGLQRVGDDDGAEAFYWYTQLGDDDLAAQLRRRVLEVIPVAAAVCKVELDTVAIDGDAWATLHHHGSHGTWGERIGVLRWDYFMHTEPLMFSGGEMEFLDGTLVQPRNNRLVIYASDQQTRIRRVECWSAHVLHGRWAISGALS